MARMMSQMEVDGAAGEHMKAMWAGQSNVLVAVRVRPLLKHDIIKKSCVRVMDSKVVVIMDPAHDKQDILRANRSREKQYAFDYVFEPGSSQDSVYHHTAKFLIHGVLDGYNATVFAYGNTGAGKTFTMIGSKSDPGIMVRVMDDLFIYTARQGKSQGVFFKATVSFLEVYNENIRDLLGDTEEYLDLREDPIAGPTVAGITEIEASTSLEIMNLLHRGNEKRSQQATAANEVSSRSHAVLQVVVECKDKAPGTVSHVKVGKLSLVDLAGSERAANTKNRGARLVEGANINRSLLALGNCINALGEKGNKGNFVPYRDSKLTRLLKDSLGGNCRTVMIANISSAESSFEETLNTLKYANRAKNIKTNVQRNVLDVNHHISEYVNLIANLRSEIKVLKDQIGNQREPDAVFDPRRMSPGPKTPISGEAGRVPHSPAISIPHSLILKQPATPLEALRESMRSATSFRGTSDGRELVMNMRQKIVDNFQERMQLRRSLIELEDQNVQNSIEMSKRQLMVVQWSEDALGLPHGHGGISGGPQLTSSIEISTAVLAHGPPEIKEALLDCEQLKKAVIKNNTMKKNIEKRLRNNERDAENFRGELSNKITGEDRKELMELQYQVGRLELENMELEQHRIVHESIMKGKELAIQKLRLQLAMKDKIIKRQRTVLQEHGLSSKVGYGQLDAMERALMSADADFPVAPPSPPRTISHAEVGVGDHSYFHAQGELYDEAEESFAKDSRIEKKTSVGGKAPPLIKKNKAVDAETNSSKSGIEVDGVKAGVAQRRDRKASNSSHSVDSNYSEIFENNVSSSNRDRGDEYEYRRDAKMHSHHHRRVSDELEEESGFYDDDISGDFGGGAKPSARKNARDYDSEDFVPGDKRAPIPLAGAVSPRREEKKILAAPSKIRVGGGLNQQPLRLKGVSKKASLSTVDEQQKWMDGGAAADLTVEILQPHSPRMPNSSNQSSRERLLFLQSNAPPRHSDGAMDSIDDGILTDVDTGDVVMEESLDEVSIMSDISEQGLDHVPHKGVSKGKGSNKHKALGRLKQRIDQSDSNSHHGNGNQNIPDLAVDGYSGFGRGGSNIAQSHNNANAGSLQQISNRQQRPKPVINRPVKHQLRSVAGGNGAAVIYPSSNPVVDPLAMQGFAAGLVSNSSHPPPNRSALPTLLPLSVASNR